MEGIEVSGEKPMLLLSVYMSCRGIRENVEEYEDCLAQLHEIMQKYGSTHHVIVGGDFNEDISSQKAGRRQQGLSMFLEENKLSTKTTGKIYVNPSGAEISTLDCVLWREPGGKSKTYSVYGQPEDKCL